MLACINYSFTLYLNPGLNGLRSFFSISYLNLKSQLKSFRKAKHLLFRQHWTYIHRCLDLVRSNRRYGTALNSVAYFARSKSRLREWKTFDPELHALEILFGNLPHQISTINFKLFMCSKWKRKQVVGKVNSICAQSQLELLRSINVGQCDAVTSLKKSTVIQTLKKYEMIIGFYNPGLDGRRNYFSKGCWIWSKSWKSFFFKAQHFT